MPQCVARSTRSGEQCRKQAIKGATVCRTHGAAAPQVKRAAAARALRLDAISEAERMVARAGVDVDPIEHLLDSLYRAAALTAVWGEMVAVLDATAATETAADGRIRGELGYDERETERGRLEIVVTPKDRLLTVNQRGESQVHPFVREYEQALERRAKFAKMALDAGVAERQTYLAEQQGEMIADVIRGVLLDLDVFNHPDAPAVVRRHLAAVPGGLAA